MYLSARRTPTSEWEGAFEELEELDFTEARPPSSLPFWKTGSVAEEVKVIKSGGQEGPRQLPERAPRS